MNALTLDIVLWAAAIAAIGITLASAARAARRAAAARAIRTVDTLEREGDIVGEGRAEPEGLPEPMITVEIHQHGTERRTKNGRRHTWTEVDRTVDQKPFWLFAANGEVARVEPGPNVKFAE